MIPIRRAEAIRRADRQPDDRRRDPRDKHRSAHDDDGDTDDIDDLSGDTDPVEIHANASGGNVHHVAAPNDDTSSASEDEGERHLDIEA